jgi:hypothetical protein
MGGVACLERLSLATATLLFLLTTWRSGTAPGELPERIGLIIANTSGYSEIRAQHETALKTTAFPLECDDDEYPRIVADLQPSPQRPRQSN